MCLRRWVQAQCKYFSRCRSQQHKASRINKFSSSDTTTSCCWDTMCINGFWAPEVCVPFFPLPVTFFFRDIYFFKKWNLSWELRMNFQCLSRGNTAHQAYHAVTEEGSVEVVLWFIDDVSTIVMVTNLCYLKICDEKVLVNSIWQNNARSFFNFHETSGSDSCFETGMLEQWTETASCTKTRQK